MVSSKSTHRPLVYGQLGIGRVPKQTSPGEFHLEELLEYVILRLAKTPFLLPVFPLSVHLGLSSSACTTPSKILSSHPWAPSSEWDPIYCFPCYSLPAALGITSPYLNPIPFSTRSALFPVLCPMEFPILLQSTFYLN